MYDHLEQGFWAANAPEFEDGVTPFLTNDDAIILWAYSKMLATTSKSSKR